MKKTFLIASSIFVFAACTKPDPTPDPVPSPAENAMLIGNWDTQTRRFQLYLDGVKEGDRSDTVPYQDTIDVIGSLTFSDKVVSLNFLDSDDDVQLNYKVKGDYIYAVEDGMEDTLLHIDKLTSSEFNFTGTFVNEGSSPLRMEIETYNCKKRK